MAPTPSAAAMRRMDSATSPSASARSIAARTIVATERPGFGPRVGSGAPPHISCRLRRTAAPPSGRPALSSRDIAANPKTEYVVRICRYSVHSRRFFVRHGQDAVIADGLGKRFGPKQALQGFDLAVPEGTVCGLLG